MSKLPPNASVAAPIEGAKLSAPSALRNLPAILELMQSHAPATGRALEIASGTGQHVTALARAVPDIDWYPTELADERIASIDGYAADAQLTNLHPAQHLDAANIGWSATHVPYNLVYLGNLLHLISVEAAHAVLTEAARALAPRGTAIFYGPFRRNGALTSDGDSTFDAQLRAADPAIGYKDDAWVEQVLTGCGLRVTVVPMPANNLAFVAKQDLP